MREGFKEGEGALALDRHSQAQLCRWESHYGTHAMPHPGPSSASGMWLSGTNLDLSDAHLSERLLSVVLSVLPATS